MKLSTKLTIAMVLLASASAASVGLVTYFSLERAFLPRSLERLEADLRVVTTQLESYAGNARADIEGFRAAVALNGIMRARLAGGTDPEGTPEATWRERNSQVRASRMASSSSTIWAMGLMLPAA